jgi:hypothetical protein
MDFMHEVIKAALIGWGKRICQSGNILGATAWYKSSLFAALSTNRG